MSTWTMTQSGRRFTPADPLPDDVDIEDIAHALAHVCRYGGHVRRFYSVAEHSVLVSRAVGARDPALALAALLHDAAEAYLGDVPRPIKTGLDMAGWHAAERRLEDAIGVRFGVVLRPMHPLVREIDDRILLDEWAELMPPTPLDIGAGQTEPLGVRIHGMPPADARTVFLIEYRRLARGPA